TPRAMVVEAESGLGKTQLLEAFQTRAHGEGYRILWATANSVERFVPYAAWRPVFSELLGVKAEPDTRATVRRVSDLFGDRASLLNALFPWKIPDRRSVRAMSPEQRGTATHDLLLDILSRYATEPASGIVLDDAQWMDSVSWQLA